MIDEIETITNEQEYLTVKETAERLGISPARVNQKIVKGHLPAKRDGHKYLIAIEDVARHKLERSHSERAKPQEAEILSNVINTILTQSQEGAKIASLEEVTTQLRVWRISVKDGDEQVTYQVIFDGKRFTVS